MKTLLIITSFLVSTALVSTGQAEHLSAEGEAWAERITAAENLRLAPIDPVKQPLTPEAQKQLTEIAEEQAQVWADTILEGDYQAESALTVERIETVEHLTEFLGYRITYSSAAYDISNCDAAADLSACTPGRIIESTLVAPALDSWVRDRTAYAEFVPREAGAVSNQ